MEMTLGKTSMRLSDVQKAEKVKNDSSISKIDLKNRWLKMKTYAKLKEMKERWKRRLCS